jgi:Fur family peroxide stress response transcriptional regulator
MLDKVIQRIKDKGGRMTVQRIAILEWLEKLDHPTAEEIFQYTHDRFPSLSFTTVYNTLKSFKELGVVQEYYMEERSRFELAEKPHPHFHCLQCGCLKDMDPGKIKIIVDETMEKELSPVAVELFFHGFCQDCKGNEDKS